MELFLCLLVFLLGLASLVFGCMFLSDLDYNLMINVSNYCSKGSLFFPFPLLLFILLRELKMSLRFFADLLVTPKSLSATLVLFLMLGTSII